MYLRASHDVPGRPSHGSHVCRKDTARAIRLAAVALAFAVAGCAAFRVPEPPPTPTPIEPVWSEAEFRDHIRYLNGSGVSGRASGTQAYARAAEYVAARLHDYRVQPAVEGDFRLIYNASINYPSSAAIRSVRWSDSLIFLPGIDFLPDARSDSGAVSVSHFIIAGESVEASGRPFGVVVPPDGPANLEDWRDAGAAAAVLVGELYPRFRPEPVRGLLIVQMTPGAARRLLGIGDRPIEAFSGTTIDTRRTVHVRVSTIYQPRAGAINILGYVSGKHPERQRELVVLCADLDAAGHFAGVETLDFRNFGIGTAAVLEIARNLSYVSRRWSVPERSVMMAVWSGSELGHEGLRYFLENPTWDLTRVRSVVYLGLDRGDQAAVREMLSGYGINLISIPPAPEPLYPSEILLLPDAEVSRRARPRGGEPTRMESPDMSAIIDSAIVRAAEMADAGYGRLMLESTDVAPFYPVLEDTLAVPQASPGSR